MSEELVSREGAKGAKKSDVEIRALSLLQPWASLLVFAEKQVETRSWRTNYRGPVAIHASQSPALWNSDYDGMRSYVEEKAMEFYKSLFPGKGWTCNYGFGTQMLIGIGTLVDCVPTSSIKGGLAAKEISLGDYSDGRWAWKFENMRPIRPIGAKGALGLWRVRLPEEVVNG